MDNYSILMEGPLSKIDKLVSNFETMNFKRNSISKHQSEQIKSYTNFSVSEILKPNFRTNFSERFDSDSDGISSVNSLELYSSGEDESQSFTNETPLSRSPDYIHNFERLDTSTTFNRNLPHRGTKKKFNYLFKEEDGFSSDCSDNEAALDLRIQRKKTPPKITDQLPAWVFCTRYSDRPSAGPRVRKPRQKSTPSHKRNRTAFTSAQLHQLILEFDCNPYLSESRRQRLADELHLNEASIKIWFQNQRAKTKKDDLPHPLALRLARDGLYNHKTVVGEK